MVWDTLKWRCYVSYYTKSIENIIIITLYTFSLNSVFTTGSLARYCLQCFCYLIYKRNEHETFLITIIKSDACMKLKYIRISLDIYQHISYQAESKQKEEIDILTMKTHQMPNKWQYVTCIKVSISNQNLKKWYSDTQTVTCEWKLHNYITHWDYFLFITKINFS